MTNSCKCVTLEDRHYLEAERRVSSSQVYVGSHRGEAANQVGFLGEVVFEEFLKYKAIEFVDMRTETTHDYLISKSLTVDVKTKDRTVPPRGYFDNSVPLYNHEHQRPDYYYFISLLRSSKESSSDIKRFKNAYLLGGMSIAALESQGKHWEAGETDPSNGTTFWTACINVNMDALVSNKEMLECFKGV